MGAYGRMTACWFSYEPDHDEFDVEDDTVRRFAERQKAYDEGRVACPEGCSSRTWRSS
jgi:hypothetical protein